MAGEFMQAQGQQVRNKNKPLNTNAVAYRRNEEERAYRSMLESRGLDPDDPRNAKKAYVYIPWPKALYFEDGMTCLVGDAAKPEESEAQLKALLAKGWSQKPFPAKEQISELDLLRRELAQLKTAQADQNELSALRRELAELRQQVTAPQKEKKTA